MLLQNSQNIIPLYSNHQDIIKKIVKNKNLNKEATYFMPTKYLSYEIAKVAFIFNGYFNNASKHSDIYRTFFASSHIEALNGTIKNIRHNNWQNSRKNGRVLIFDETNSLSHFFNPLNVKKECALIPGVDFVATIEEVNEALANETLNPIIGFICCRNNQLPIDQINKWLQTCSTKKIMFALDEAQLTDWYKQHLSNLALNTLPDIFIFGENLVKHEVPFGSFSMCKKAYQPWNNLADCLNHSSSNSGNTLTLSMILYLFKEANLDNEVDSKIKTHQQRINFYKRHVNPIIGSVFDSIKLTPDILAASGSTLKIKNYSKHEDIIDLVGGSGCSLRGHNPEDLISQVLNCHNENINYWGQLASKLCILAGLQYAMPSISGSSAVDLSVIIAMMASYPKTRIVTFNQNYSGKSLIALNMTRFQSYRLPFFPLYFDMLEIDPFAPNACNKFIEICNDDKPIAMVWFELMRGNDLRVIPQSLLDVITQEKAKQNYIIAVDEVLTGMYRTGTFLYSQQKNIPFDIVTVGKGLTDMSFPQGATLLSEDVYTKAKKYNSQLVDKLSFYYSNQLGAHIALHALNKVIEDDIGKRVQENGQTLKEELKKISDSVDFISKINGTGMIQYMTLNKNSWIIKLFGEELTEFLLSSFYLKYCNILLLNSRFTPSLYLTKEEIQKASLAIKKALHGKKHRIFLFNLSQVIKTYISLLILRMKELFE